MYQSVHQQNRQDYQPNLHVDLHFVRCPPIRQRLRTPILLLDLDESAWLNLLGSDQCLTKTKVNQKDTGLWAGGRNLTNIAGAPRSTFGIRVREMLTWHDDYAWGPQIAFFTLSETTSTSILCSPSWSSSPALLISRLKRETANGVFGVSVIRSLNVFVSENFSCSLSSSLSATNSLADSSWRWTQGKATPQL
jgi:hypothetical protein